MLQCDNENLHPELSGLAKTGSCQDCVVWEERYTRNQVQNSSVLCRNAHFLSLPRVLGFRLVSRKRGNLGLFADRSEACWISPLPPPLPWALAGPHVLHPPLLELDWEEPARDKFCAPIQCWKKAGNRRIAAWLLHNGFRV